MPTTFLASWQKIYQSSSAYWFKVPGEVAAMLPHSLDALLSLPASIYIPRVLNEEGKVRLATAWDAGCITYSAILHCPSYLEDALARANFCLGNSSGSSMTPVQSLLPTP